MAIIDADSAGMSSYAGIGITQNTDHHSRLTHSHSIAHNSFPPSACQHVVDPALWGCCDLVIEEIQGQTFCTLREGSPQV